MPAYRSALSTTKQENNAAWIFKAIIMNKLTCKIILSVFVKTNEKGKCSGLYLKMEAGFKVSSMMRKGLVTEYSEKWTHNYYHWNIFTRAIKPGLKRWPL